MRLPPLVGAGGDGASADDGRSEQTSPSAGGLPEVERYTRTSRLAEIGLDGQQRIGRARVLVVGAGGLGSPVIQYLAMSGVRTLGIVDHDVVDVSNLQRQVLYRPDQVGLPKARAAADWVRAANGSVDVRVHAFLLEKRTASIFDDYDIVVDGSDSFDTCYVVADAAAERGLPVVWASVSRFDGQIGVFWDAAPDGRGVDYRDLHPEPPADGFDESCSDVGVLGPLCGTVGSVMASEVLKLVTGAGEPLLGRIATIDALTGTWRESRLVRSPERQATRAQELGTPRHAAPQPEAQVRVIAADALESRLAARAAGTDDFALVDVRERQEHDVEAIPGSVLAAGFGSTTPVRPELDPAVPVVVYCAREPRSRAAARLLAQEGYDVTVLTRGMLGWTLRPSALAGAASPTAGTGRVPLPLGDIDPDGFRPNLRG